MQPDPPVENTTDPAAHINLDLKFCSKCSQRKSLDKFSTHKRAPDGLQSTCKSCQSSLRKEYYKNKKEIILEKAREDRLSNPEKINAIRTKSRVKNKVAANARRVKQRAESLNEWQTHEREWRDKNKDKIKEYAVKWRANNYEKTKEYTNRYRAKKRNTALG